MPYVPLDAIILQSRRRTDIPKCRLSPLPIMPFPLSPAPRRFQRYSNMFDRSSDASATRHDLHFTGRPTNGPGGCDMNGTHLGERDRRHLPRCASLVRPKKGREQVWSSGRRESIGKGIGRKARKGNREKGSKCYEAVTSPRLFFSNGGFRLYERYYLIAGQESGQLKRVRETER